MALKRTNSLTNTDGTFMKLKEGELQALTYGDFLTHKVNLMFPKLFK